MPRKKRATKAVKVVKYDYDSDEYKQMLGKETKEINRQIMEILNEAGARWEADQNRYPGQIAATLYTMIAMDSIVGILGLAAILYPDPIKFFEDTMPQISNQTVKMFEATYKSFALAMAAKYAMPIAGDETKVH